MCLLSAIHSTTFTPLSRLYQNNLVSSEAILDFLEVAEHEAYANVMYCVMAAIETGLVALFIIALEANLVVVGLVSLTHEAFFFFINILIANRYVGAFFLVGSDVRCLLTSLSLTKGWAGCDALNLGCLEGAR